MNVSSVAADPAFPQLEIATDPTLMKQTFRTHLRPVGPKVYDIEDCRFIRLRYRQGSRCFLLYTLRFVEPDTGCERNVQVTGLIYAQKDKAEQAWRKLKATDPRQEIPNAATLDDRLLHGEVLDRFTGSSMLPCYASLGSDHARFLRGFAPAGKRRRYPNASSMPSAACLPMLGIQCEYLSRVIVMEACPRRCWTSFG